MSQRVDLVVGLTAAALAGLFAGWRLAGYGVPYSAQIRLWASVLFGIVLPGLIVLRHIALRTLPSRLGAAFTVGLFFQLISWWVAVKSGVDVALWALPLLLAFLLSAALERMSPQRRVLTEAHRPRPLRTPWWASLSLAGVWFWTIRHLDGSLWLKTPLDRSQAWYKDMDWQLSLSANALHSAPVFDPQSSAEGVLAYHWFGNAHAAALSLSTGVGIDQVGILYWYVPVTAALLGLVYGMAASLASSPSTGLLASAMVPFSPVFLLSPALDSNSTSAMIWQSQSHVFSLPIMTLTVWAAIELLRGPRNDALLSVGFAGLALLSSGAKVSILPTIIGGSAVVLLLTLRRSRREAIRPLVLCGAAALIVLGTSPLFAGGGGGSGFTYASTPQNLKVFRKVLAEPLLTADWLVKTLIIVCVAATFLPSLLALGAHRRTPDASLRPRPLGGSLEPSSAPPDPAVPFFFGMTAFAIAAHSLLGHPSFSQVYFLRGMAPVTAVFVAWGAAESVRRLRRPSQIPTSSRANGVKAVLLGPAGIVLAGGTGLGLYALARAVESTSNPTIDNWGLVALATLSLALLTGTVRLFTARGARRSAAAGYTAVLLLGYSLAPELGHIGGPEFALSDPAHPEIRPASALQIDEVKAARFLARENQERRLVATNVHCLHIKTKPHCDSRGFWVSSMTESPVFIGGWAYTDSARRRNGHDRHIYFQQLYENEDDFRLNEAAFQDPTAGILEQMKAKGVGYLYADRRASAVSPRLKELATELWNSENAAVYRLR